MDGNEYLVNTVFDSLITSNQMESSKDYFQCNCCRAEFPIKSDIIFHEYPDFDTFPHEVHCEAVTLRKKINECVKLPGDK